MFEQLHGAFDVPVFGGPQQCPVVVLGQFAQAHGFQVETQEPLFFDQTVFDQIQQPAIGRPAVKRHVEQAIEPADFGVVALRFEFVDVTGSLFEIFVPEQWHRETQGFGFQQDAQRIGFHGVALDQRRDHGALMGNHVEQRLCFELAQGLAYGHAADAEQVGEVLLAQGRTARNAPVEYGRAQGFFDHRACHMSGNRPVDLDTAERVGLLCH
ncbi:hypothetical protein D3C86_996630 [compost metagenome]